MLLQSHARFDVVAEFDPDRRLIGPCPRPADLPLSRTAGWFDILSGVCVVLFLLDGRLYVDVGDARFPVDNDLEIHWVAEGEDAVFTIGSGEEHVELRYYRWGLAGPPIEGDWTPTEPDHWDIGMFIAKVASDPERQARLSVVLAGAASGDASLS